MFSEFQSYGIGMCKWSVKLGNESEMGRWEVRVLTPKVGSESEKWSMVMNLGNKAGSESGKWRWEVNMGSESGKWKFDLICKMKWELKWGDSGLLSPYTVCTIY